MATKRSKHIDPPTMATMADADTRSVPTKLIFFHVKPETRLSEATALPLPDEAALSEETALS